MAKNQCVDVYSPAVPMRISTSNVLFVPEAVKVKLDKNVYESNLKKFNKMSMKEIADHLQYEGRLRSVTPEEYIAALDRVTPDGVRLFDLLVKAKHMRINQRDVEKNVRDMRLYREFSGRAGETPWNREKLDEPQEILLNIALKFHRLALDSLVGQRFMSTTYPSSADIAKVDSYLARSLEAFEEAGAVHYSPVRGLADLPLLRELSYFFWFRWGNPIEYHRPSLVDLSNSVSNPERYSRQLFWRLGPSLTINWIFTHLRIATLIWWAIAMPNYGVAIYNAAGEVTYFTSHLGN